MVTNSYQWLMVNYPTDWGLALNVFYIMGFFCLSFANVFYSYNVEPPSHKLVETPPQLLEVYTNLAILGAKKCIHVRSSE